MANDKVLTDPASIQKRISEREIESIVARWELGLILLKQRNGGKQLPRGRAEWRVGKWIDEVGDDRQLRDELVKVLQAALDELTATVKLAS